MRSHYLESMSQHHASVVQPALLANHTSHFFNLHDPSLMIDTAFSSSMHALHLASSIPEPARRGHVYENTSMMTCL